MGTVFTSTVPRALKKTLELIIDDKSDEKKLVMPKWLDQRSMSDNWEDDLETAGPGLIAEKEEGSEISTGSIMEGYTTRYIARTFALKLIITEEAIEDNKYDKVHQAAKRLRRALYKTVDVDSTNILVRMFNTSYTGGDGLPLGSASHTLPHGGTFSNVMGTPLSPSRQAMIVATSAIRKLPGHDGTTEGYEPKKVVCPTEQWATWSMLTKSANAPEAGEFNAINVVNSDLNISVVPNKYWSNTTTQWAVITDCEYGLNFRWRRKPRNRSWVDNDQEQMKYAISARWARGWSDPRAIYCVQS